MNPVGCPPDLRREAYRLRFNMPQRKKLDHFMSRSVLDQLQLCRCDEARRIILGVSHQKDEDQPDIDEAPRSEREAGEARMRAALWWGFGRVEDEVFRQGPRPLPVARVRTVDSPRERLLGLRAYVSRTR